MPLSGGVAAAAFGTGRRRVQGVHRVRQRTRAASRARDRAEHRRRPVRPCADAERRQRPARRGCEPLQRDHRLTEQRRRSRRAQRGVRAPDARPHRLTGVGRGRRLSVDHRRPDPVQPRVGGVRRAHRRAVPRRRDGRAVHRGQRLRRGVPHGVRSGGRGGRDRDRRHADASKRPTAPRHRRSSTASPATSRTSSWPCHSAPSARRS